MSDLDRVDVVVVAYQSADVIEACVRSALDVPECGTVVVVDHGRDGSGALASAAGATVVLDPSNPGFGAGQNHGVARTSAPAVLLLNPDAALEPGVVASGLAYLTDHPRVAAVQGVVLGADGEPERSAGALIRPVHLAGRAVGARRLLRFGAVRRLAGRSKGLADHVDRRPTEPAEVECLAATAVLVRRDAFDSVGGFDERYFLYGEDLDLCRRLKASGWSVVALPETWARHRNGASSGSSWERELHWWRGTMAYAARWWDGRDWAMALAAAGVRWTRLAATKPKGASRAWKALITGPRADRRARIATRLPRSGARQPR